MTNPNVRPLAQDHTIALQVPDSDQYFFHDPGMAILRHDHTPRPSYVAYATMTRVLERAKYLGTVEGMSETQRGFRFEKRGKIIRVLWDTRGASRLTLEVNSPAALINLVGGSSMLKPAEGKLIVPLSLDPVYVIIGE